MLLGVLFRYFHFSKFPIKALFEKTKIIKPHKNCKILCYEFFWFTIYYANRNNFELEERMQDLGNSD